MEKVSNQTKIPQGVIREDKTYVWRCPCHNGKPCNWCYENDSSMILNSLSKSRENQYYANLKAYLSIQGKAIIIEAQKMAQLNGKFSPRHILELADKFCFPRNRIKALIEWLEECQFLPSGTYEKLKNSPNWKPLK